MKKRTLASLSLAALLALSGCSSSQTGDTSTGDKNTQQTETPAEPYQIGIIQQLEHASLDEIYEGIIAAMADQGYVDGENIAITYLNGQNDLSNLKTISQQFVSNNCDLIIGIATSACQSAAAETTEIPIVAAAVTDMEAAGLVASNDAPGGNVTGVSDETPVDKQLELLLQLIPAGSTVGVAYCSSEVNSQVQVNNALAYLDSVGVPYETGTVTNVNDIPQSLEALAQKVDALYIPVDNTLASAMPQVNQICVEHKLPLVVGAAAMVEEGALGSVAFDYYDVGYQSGEMAVRILEGADPATTPVEVVQDTKLVLSQAYADSIGLTLPEELLQSAASVY